MKSIFLSFLFLFGFATLHAQGDSDEVSFVAYWQKGNSYDFKVTKIKAQWKGEEHKGDTSSYIANFEVIDSTEDGYRIKWSYINSLQNFNLPEKIVEKLSEYNLPEVIYTTSDVGEFEGIENWEEVADLMNKLFKDIMDVYAEDMDEKQIATFQSVMKPLLAMYQNKEVMEKMAFKELHYLHFPFGVAYSLTDPIEYEELLPNNFGGNKPIRADAKIEVEEIDFAQERCKLRHTMKLNPKDTRDNMKLFFEKILASDPEAQKKMEKAMKSSKFEINDNNTFEFYYYPGVPILVEAVRETIIDMQEEKGKRIDITRIEWIH